MSPDSRHSTSITGLTVSSGRSMRRSRRANRSAMNTTMVNLANSEGWTTNPPNPIQRWEPFTVLPTPGMSTATNMTMTTRRAGPANLRTTR